MPQHIDLSLNPHGVPEFSVVCCALHHITGKGSQGSSTDMVCPDPAVEAKGLDSQTSTTCPGSTAFSLAVRRNFLIMNWHESSDSPQKGSSGPTQCALIQLDALRIGQAKWGAKYLDRHGVP